MLDWFRGRGNAETGPRDGEAPVLEQLARVEPSGDGIASGPVAPMAQRLDPKAVQQSLVLASLSAKVLGIHLANRFQTSYPLVLNFEALELEKAMLLAEVAAAALLSDPRAAGQPGAVRSRMVEAKAGPELLDAFDRSLVQPRALSALLPDVVTAGLGPHAYAVSLIALGRAKATGRHHLAYLASRLALGDEVVGSLRRRYQR